MTTAILTDKQHAFLKNNFNADGSQKHRIVLTTRTMRGGTRPSPEGSAINALIEAGVLKRGADFKYDRKVYDPRSRAYKAVEDTAPGFVVRPEHLSLITAPLAVSLTKNMIAILDFIEENSGGPLTANEMAQTYSWETRSYTTNTGLSAPSIKSTCEKLVEMGLLTKGKKGRSFAWTRTDAPRPDTAEERKAKIDAQRAEEERKAGREGICQCCLRQHKLYDNGTVARHGWSLMSFDRSRYGYHTRSCEGSSRSPLEQSCDLAIDMVGRFGEWLTQTDETLARLATRPALTLARGEWECLPRNADNYDDAITIEDGDVAHKRASVVNSYDKVLAKKQADTEKHRADIVEILQAFADAIEKHHKGNAAADAAVERARKAA